MVNKKSIQCLREDWRNACSQGLGAELRAYCEILSHPDVTWRDVLDGFDRPGIVSEQAWLRMRVEFKQLEPSGAIHPDAAFWRSVLDGKGIDLDTRCEADIINAVNA
jgi:hypothetical protein